MGSHVEIRLLKDINEIENSVIITGSHDPLIDEIPGVITSDELETKRDICERCKYYDE